MPVGEFQEDLRLCEGVPVILSRPELHAVGGGGTPDASKQTQHGNRKLSLLTRPRCAAGCGVGCKDSSKTKLFPWPLSARIKFRAGLAAALPLGNLDKL